MKIQVPTLLLDTERAKSNIKKMSLKAKRSGVRFRPHFKTHQSAEIGEWFRQEGVDSITVSSVDMAGYFAENGWQDITIAFPVNLLEIDKINALAKEIQLNLLVESEASVCFLDDHLERIANVWIKIDVGYRRTGLKWDADEVMKLALKINHAKKLNLSGLLTHAGHSYDAQSDRHITAIYADTVKRLTAVRKKLDIAGIVRVELSLGDTPCCSLIEDFSEVDEIRPGNFVFYDMTQLMHGVCEASDVSLAIACPVVAKHVSRNEIVVYGGAIHLSKDFVLMADGTPCFGGVAFPENGKWGPLLDQTYVASVSQEHGLIKCTDEVFGQMQLGDLLMVIPAHSCLSANLLKRYVTVAGEKIEMFQ